MLFRPTLGSYEVNIPLLRFYRLSQEKFRCLEGCGIKRKRPIFKTEMFIYQSKVNLDKEILLGSIPHLTDREIRKMLGKGMFGNKNSTFHSGL